MDKDLLTYFDNSRVDKTTQKTRDFDPMLVQCWSTVYEAGPTLVLMFAGHISSLTPSANKVNVNLVWPEIK